MDSDSTCSNDLSTTLEDVHCLKKFYNLSALPKNMDINQYINQAKYSSCSNVIEMIDEVQRVINFVEETKEIELYINDMEKVWEEEKEECCNYSFLSNDSFFNEDFVNIHIDNDNNCMDAINLN